VATYYVSKTGNNAASGTTLATAWASIDNNSASLQPGDVVMIGNGEYNLGMAGHLNIRAVGTGASPVTYKAINPWMARVASYSLGGTMAWNDVVGASSTTYSASVGNPVGWSPADQWLCAVWSVINGVTTPYITTTQAGRFSVHDPMTMNPGEAYWDGTNLYVCTGSDDAPGDEIRVSFDNNVRYNGSSYVVFENLIFEYGLKAIGNEATLGDAPPLNNGWHRTHHCILRHHKRNTWNPADYNHHMSGNIVHDIGLDEGDYIIYTRSNNTKTVMENNIFYRCTGYYIHEFGAAGTPSNNNYRKNVFYEPLMVRSDAAEPPAFIVLDASDDGKQTVVEDCYFYAGQKNTVSGLKWQMSAVALRCNDVTVRNCYMDAMRHAFLLQFAQDNVLIENNQIYNCTLQTQTSTAMTNITIRNNRWSWGGPEASGNLQFPFVYDGANQVGSALNSMELLFRALKNDAGHDFTIGDQQADLLAKRVPIDYAFWVAAGNDPGHPVHWYFPKAAVGGPSTMLNFDAALKDGEPGQDAPQEQAQEAPKKKPTFGLGR
jgi:hypothetical protein